MGHCPTLAQSLLEETDNGASSYDVMKCHDGKTAGDS